jgi:two-component system, cell cycle sensor histidine kinase and response regulator CckA
MIYSIKRILKKQPAERVKRAYDRQFRGAVGRSVSSLLMWTFALLAFWMGVLKAHHLIGITASVIYLILISPPLLFILKYLTKKSAYAFVSLLTNLLEIIGYTAIIYFCGGIEATYLTPLYAALIAAVGVTAPRQHLFIVAGLSVITYNTMVVLVYLGILPHFAVLPNNTFPALHVASVLGVVNGLLFVVAYLSGMAANVLKSHRNKLQLWNTEINETNEKLKTEIEERKLAEEALRESKSRYRIILESIEDGYYEIDRSGNFTFFNDAMLKIFGYSRDELKGMNYRQYMDNQSIDRISDIFKAAFNTGDAQKEVEWEITKKDGNTCHITASISLIKDANDQPGGFRGIMRDTSERKLVETEKQKLQEQLQRAQKMEAIGMLAGGVAHDLNNILSGLTSYPELLLMDLPEDSPLREIVLTIKKSGEKSVAVVQDLLTLARRGVAVTEPVDLNEVISDYLASPEYAKTKSSNPHIDVETDLVTDAFNIIGSRIHLQKTIMNLVSNAVEAMPAGGRILIFTENRYIDKPVKGYDEVTEGEYVTLTVADTGLGISDKDLKRIFEPFYTKKKMGRSGTGLGMAVVWGTVKDHSGYIDILSKRGKGTTVTLYFPITRKQTAAAPSQQPIEAFMGNGESILVVDDIAEQREIATRILTKLNYTASSVSSGEQAVGLLKNQSVDLLVLDMIMDPGLDGLETYKRIIKLHPGQKAIIASGFSETDRVQDAQSLGVGGYIKKPYTIEKIGMAVREELDR